MCAECVLYVAFAVTMLLKSCSWFLVLNKVKSRISQWSNAKATFCNLLQLCPVSRSPWSLSPSY